MQYTYLELVTYLYVYSMLGWVLEIGVMAIREHRFCNRGFFNLPICLTYGITIDILLIVLPTLEYHYFYQLIVAMVTASVVESFSGGIAKYIWKNNLWKYERNNMFGIERTGLIFSALRGAIFLLVVGLLHPVLFILDQMLPAALDRIFCIIITVLLLFDFISILYAIRIKRRQQMDKAQVDEPQADKAQMDKLQIDQLQMDEFQKQNQETKAALGNWIYHSVWNRLNKAYPNIEQVEQPEETAYIFAHGICFDKLVWVFLISALLGDVIETLYCRFVSAGIWMSRSSLIYGSFSVIWGMGAVLLTVVLQKLAAKDDRYVFLSGCVLGGVYEYMCSVFSEVFLGTVFWDYSDMPFNIGGRTNLLFCFFWGILSVLWVKVCYPALSGWIEKVPALAGKIATWVMIVFMLCDAFISVAAMNRYIGRRENRMAESAVEEFIDYHYPDELVETVWPNMRIR